MAKKRKRHSLDTRTTFCIENQTCYSTADIETILKASCAHTEIENPRRGGFHFFVRVHHWQGRKNLVRGRLRGDLVEIEIVEPRRASKECVQALASLGAGTLLGEARDELVYVCRHVMANAHHGATRASGERLWRLSGQTQTDLLDWAHDLQVRIEAREPDETPQWRGRKLAQLIAEGERPLAQLLAWRRRWEAFEAKLAKGCQEVGAPFEEVQRRLGLPIAPNGVTDDAVALYRKVMRETEPAEWLTQSPTAAEAGDG